MEINYDKDDDFMYYQPSSYYMQYIRDDRTLCIVCQVEEPAASRSVCELHGRARARLEACGIDVAGYAAPCFFA